MKRCVLTPAMLGLALLALLIAPALLPAAAQDGGLSDEDLALVAFVAGTFEHFAELESYSIVGMQTLSQEITTEQNGTTTALSQNIAQEMDGQYARAEEDETLDGMAQVVQTVIMTLPGQPTVELQMTMDIVLLAPAFYLRIAEISELGQGLVPVGQWINLAEDTSSIPGMEMFSIEGLTSLTRLQIVQYPVTASTVTAIEELDGETLDDIVMRVFSITLDPIAIYEEGGAEALASIFDPTAFPGDPEEFIRTYFAGVTLEISVWISAEGELPYRVDTALAGEFDLPADVTGSVAMTVEQAVSTSQIISAINEPVEVIAPEIEE